MTCNKKSLRVSNPCYCCSFSFHLTQKPPFFYYYYFWYCGVDDVTNEKFIVVGKVFLTILPHYKMVGCAVVSTILLYCYSWICLEVVTCSLKTFYLIFFFFFLVFIIMLFYFYLISKYGKIIEAIFIWDIVWESELDDERSSRCDNSIST